MSSLHFGSALLPSGWADGVQVAATGGSATKLAIGTAPGPPDERHRMAVPAPASLHRQAYRRGMALILHDNAQCSSIARTGVNRRTGRNPSTSTRDTTMRSLGIFAATAAFLVAAPAVAEDVKVGIGISGWTGFAPLTLANQAGIFKKNGLDVTIKKIPQKDRHLAIASGDVQCAATTVETWISWNANGVATKQIFQLDKSYGADGMVTRNDVASIKDLKGKTIAASVPGTSPYFALAWMLKKNGLSVKDVTVANLEPAAAAQAFVAGQNDAAMTYEPYLSTVRAAPDKGKIIATTLDYPMVMDTFGCTPKFLTDNPKAAKALADSYFEAVAMIEKDQAKSYEIMGADVKQSGEQFGNSAKYLRWQDKAANQKFFVGEFQAFNKEAADLLLEIGIIKSIPDVDDLFDASFIK
jgi:NitT/TauT family transport system substrate-binding protein